MNINEGVEKKIKHRKTSLFHDTVLSLYISHIIYIYTINVQRVTFIYSLKKSYNSISYLKCSGMPSYTPPLLYIQCITMYCKCIRYRKRNAVNSLRIFLSAWTVNAYIPFFSYFTVFNAIQGILVTFWIEQKTVK